MKEAVMTCIAVSPRPEVPGLCHRVCITMVSPHSSFKGQETSRGHPHSWVGMQAFTTVLPG
jgi:hypothetical protein